MKSVDAVNEINFEKKNLSELLGMKAIQTEEENFQNFITNKEFSGSGLQDDGPRTIKSNEKILGKNENIIKFLKNTTEYDKMRKKNENLRNEIKKEKMNEVQEKLNIKNSGDKKQNDDQVKGGDKEEKSNYSN